MKQKRFFALTIIIVLIFAMLAGCGSQKSDAPTEIANESTAENVSPSAPSDYGSGVAQFDKVATEAKAPEAVVNEPKKLPRDAKLIITADLSLETTEFTKAQAAIDALVSKYGGYFERASTSSGSFYSESNIRNASYTIRVPKDNYKKFLSEIGNSCHLVNISESAEDVGAAYFDTELRLKTQKTKHERLLVLLEKAEKMEDIISIESALSDVQYQIDQFSSELKRYDNLVGFATVNASLQEVIKLSDVDKNKNEFLPKLKKAIVGGFEIAGEAIQEFIITIAYCLPVIVVAVIAFGTGFGIIRKRQKAKKNKIEQLKDEKKQDDKKEE